MKKIILGSTLLLLCSCSQRVICKHNKHVQAQEVTFPTDKIATDQKEVIKESEQDIKQETSDNDLYLIDTVKAVIYGAERTDVITVSDVTRPSIDGNKQTLDDLVLAKLVCQDAIHYKMEPDNDAVENHLKAVQRENNLSLDDLKSIFSNAGYTYEEGKEQFKAMTAIGTMIDFRVRSRLIVPEKDIQAYYQEHPQIQEASYQIARAQELPPQGMDRDVFMRELQKLVETGTCKLEIDWSEPFWIKKSELASDKQFITTLQVGSIGMGSESASGIELYKLLNNKEERLMSLEERYNDIADILKRPKYNELFEQYKKDLFSHAAVIYF